MAYPGQPGVDPLWPWFSQVAGADQQIDGEELQKALTASGINGSYKPFSLETCRIMIAMLDRDHSGKMGFTEFKELWNAINSWKGTFINFDRDRSGTVEPHELHQAIASFGYTLSPNALMVLVNRYSTGGRIGFDDFVSCVVRLRALTTTFQSRDTQRNGHAQFQYDDFIRCVMSI